MIYNRRIIEAVCLKGEVYVFGGYGVNETWIRSVEKYSPDNNSWINVANMYDTRQSFCACALMDKIFIIGGCTGFSVKSKVYNSCLQFHTTDYSWKEVARMNEIRSFAGCAVFEGAIVICGGRNHYFNISNTVESYDIAADVWTQLPNMKEERYHHNLVVVKSKLFVIGGGNTDTCEVFDNTANTFVSFKSQHPINFNTSLSIGNKIFIFQNKMDKSFVVSYDVNNDKWSEESCAHIENLLDFSCVKLPFC